jgi:hypothetical protein
MDPVAKNRILSSVLERGFHPKTSFGVVYVHLLDKVIFKQTISSFFSLKISKVGYRFIFVATSVLFYTSHQPLIMQLV